MKDKILGKIHYAVILLVFIFLAFLTESFLFFYKQNQNNFLRDKVSIEANKVQTSLHNEINSSLNLVLGLIGYINTVDELTHENFNKIAETILRESSIIKNIGLAPDNIISYMYPMKGNEKAIGLDYMKTDAQKSAVIKAIKSRNTLIAGPVELVQGGRGFIARIPVFKGNNGEDYWGIASIVVDEMKLYDKVRILHGWHWIKYALKGTDGKGAYGDQFFGDKAVFENNPVTYNVLLPEGSWILAAYPKQGWNNVALKDVILFRSIGYFVSIILTALLLSLFRTNIKLRYYAHVDPLTGIANRRCFHYISEKILYREKREKGKLCFLYFDLDGFKTVNDKYGHRAGDAVLKKAVKRIKRSTRETDVFARMGGDEFIFLPQSVKDEENMRKLAEKIISEISSPYHFENRTITIGCSIGISIYPENGETIDDLVKNADQAMYVSKDNDGNRITFYNDINTDNQQYENQSKNIYMY